VVFRGTSTSDTHAIEPVAARASTTAATREHPGFRHEALLYAQGDHGFVAGTLPLVAQALADDAAVLVAVSNARAQALTEALGEDSERVRFLDMPKLGRNPARIIPRWREFLDETEQETASHALGIGEPVWPGRTHAELEECERHESLLNLAFDGGLAWHLLCPYDLDGLDDGVIEAAERTHPLMAQDGIGRLSNRYACAHQAPSPFAGQLQPPRATQARRLSFTAAELSSVRHAVAQWARSHSLGLLDTEDLVLAVNELATNSVRYGGGRGTLRIWREGEVLICEIESEGLIEEPLLGRVRPAPSSRTGRGVWLANQLCDLLQIRSLPGGSVFRVHKALT
jgi:anti-sigma regulatory factor (Ser/Thr protein kinase)